MTWRNINNFPAITLTMQINVKIFVLCELITPSSNGKIISIESLLCKIPSYIFIK